MKYYEDIEEIQKLIWRNGDCLFQEDLINLQDKIAGLALKIAKEEKQVERLAKTFPYLYRVKETQ